MIPRHESVMGRMRYGSSEGKSALGRRRGGGSVSVHDGVRSSNQLEGGEDEPLSGTGPRVRTPAKRCFQSRSLTYSP